MINKKPRIAGFFIAYAFLPIQFRSSKATSRRFTKVSSPLRNHTRGS